MFLKKRTRKYIYFQESPIERERIQHGDIEYHIYKHSQESSLE